MAGFSLPTENIPEWAKDVPEDEWHKQVLRHTKTDNKNDQISRQQNVPESARTSSPQTWPAKCVTGSTSSNDDWTAHFDDAD